MCTMFTEKIEAGVYIYKVVRVQTTVTKVFEGLHTHDDRYYGSDYSKRVISYFQTGFEWKRGTVKALYIEDSEEQNRLKDSLHNGEYVYDGFIHGFPTLEEAMVLFNKLERQNPEFFVAIIKVKSLGYTFRGIAEAVDYVVDGSAQICSDVVEWNGEVYLPNKNQWKGVDTEWN